MHRRLRSWLKSSDRKAGHQDVVALLDGGASAGGGLRVTTEVLLDLLDHVTGRQDLLLAETDGGPIAVLPDLPENVHTLLAAVEDLAEEFDNDRQAYIERKAAFCSEINEQALKAYPPSQ